MRVYKKLGISQIVKQATPKPILELSPGQIEKLKNFSDALLGILNLVGVATVAVLAPNALRMFDLFEKRGNPKKRILNAEKQQKVIRAFYYLRETGRIKFVQRGDSYEVVLTEKGQKQIKRINFETISVKTDSKWDGKFWQVAADIPTKYRLGADAFRDKLKLMNFYSLQRTLWFYPFNPRIEIEFVARTYGIDPFVTVMKIDELDISDKKLLVGYFKKAGVI